MTGSDGSGFVGSSSRFDSFHNQNQNGTMRYPSPFFDIGHTYLPTSVKQMFRWCRYYFMVNPLINAVTYKMAEYPITKIQVQEADSVLRDKWTKLIDTGLKLRNVLIEIGLDFFAYGNAFITIHWPIRKSLICSNCKSKQLAANAVYKFRNFRYYLACTNCHVTAEAGVEDLNVKDLRGIKIVRWNPEHITVEHNEVTNKTDYFFDIPVSLKNDIMMGKRHVIETIPNEFILALRETKTLKMREGEMYHLKRPTVAQKDMGWGMPLILPVLKDSYYLQVLRKAQESIANQYIVPLRIIFPQAGSGTSDPYCLSFQTLTEVNYGYKPAGEVCVGDLVKTAYGNYQPITVVNKRALQKNEKVYRFSVVGMASELVEASERHPFLAVSVKRKPKVRHTDWAPKWVFAKDLQVGDYVVYPLHREVRLELSIDLANHLTNYVATNDWIYRQITPQGATVYEYVETRDQRIFASGELVSTANVNNWSPAILQTTASRFRLGHRTSRLPRHLKWSKNFATILGYYLAEGCVNGRRIVFTLHRKETWICDELDVAFKIILGKIGIRRKHGNNGLQYSVNDSIFAEFLKNYGGHLAWNKKLPPECVNLTKEFLVELIRCLLNGDGGDEHTYRDNGTGRLCRTTAITYTTTSRDLALKLRELLLYIGIIGKVHKTPVGNRRKHTIYRVKINGQMAIDLSQKIGWPVPVSTNIKKDTTRSFIHGNYAYFKVEKKNSVDNLDFVYGFQVDGDKSFCVPACATHNSTIDLSLWRRRIEAEIEKWKLDQNYIPILPIPIGNETIGGEGKALMLHQEMRAWSEQIVAGMHVPIEFVFGGLQYSGSNVSMRMLENQFDGYRTDLLIFCRDFVLGRIASYMEWTAPDIEFSRFRMADDLQRSALIMQANQAMKVSDTTFLNELELDLVQEEKYKSAELSKQLENNRKMQIANAQLQGELQIIQARYQAQAMRIMGTVAPGAMSTLPNNPGSFGSSVGGATMDGDPTSSGNSMPGGGQPASGTTQQPLQGEESAPGMPENATVYPENADAPPAEGLPTEVQSPLNMTQAGGQMNILYLARQAANAMNKMDGMQRQLALMDMQVSHPQLKRLTLSMLQGEKGSQEDNLNPLQKPLPTQKPPRRQVSLG